MRTTTLPSMLEILTRNYNYRNKAVQLYEVGRTYLPGGEDGLADRAQGTHPGRLRRRHGLLHHEGRRRGHSEGTAGQGRDLPHRQRRCRTSPPTTPAAAPRCGAAVTAGLCSARSIPWWPRTTAWTRSSTAQSCPWTRCAPAKGADPEYVPLPKFPAVTRDIAVVCDKAVTVGALEDCIRRGAKGLLKEVSLFDIYTGTGIAGGQEERGLQPDAPLRRPQPHRRGGRRGCEEHPGDAEGRAGRRPAVICGRLRTAQRACVPSRPGAIAQTETLSRADAFRPAQIQSPSSADADAAPGGAVRRAEGRSAALDPPCSFRSSALPAITGRIFSNFMRKTLYSFSKNEYTSFVL